MTFQTVGSVFHNIVLVHKILQVRLRFFGVSYYLIQANQKKSLPRVPGCLIKKHALKLFKQDKNIINTIYYALYPQYKTQNKPQQPI